MTAPAPPAAESRLSTSGEADGAAQPTAPRTRPEQAHAIVRKNMYWAVGLGFVPVPLLDLAAVTAVQVKMLKELSAVYEVSFAEDAAQKVVGSLVAGLGGLTVAGAIAGSLIKVIPVVGQVVGFIGRPALAGALTLAVGNLFTMHYESGGTLLDFDAAKMREHFRREFESAKEGAGNVQNPDRSRVDRPPP